MLSINDLRYRDSICHGLLFDYHLHIDSEKVARHPLYPTIHSKYTLYYVESGGHKTGCTIVVVSNLIYNNKDIMLKYSVLPLPISIQ